MGAKAAWSRVMAGSDLPESAAVVVWGGGPLAVAGGVSHRGRRAVCAAVVANCAGSDVSIVADY